jgi:hypothetical protein
MFRKNKRHLQGQMFSEIDGLPEKQKVRLAESWAAVFYRDFFSRIDEQPFSALYSDDEASRPNIPVNVLVGLEALKAGFNWSDEEMYDAFCFDLQVRYALGYRNLGEGQFDLRTVYNFRQRLSQHVQETGESLVEKAFEGVTDEQVKAFELKTGKVRMDSTEIESNIRNMSRLHLLVEVIQRVRRMLSEVDRTRYEEAFAPYMKGTSGQYVYRVKGEDGAEHMQRIGELMYKLVRELASDYKGDATYKILQRVFAEHFLVEGERLRLKTGKELRADSLNSPDDVEATFRKKNGRSYKGHVANVTETCDPENPLQLIVKIQTAPNVTNDDDMLIEAVPSLKERLGVNELHTDGGYNSAESYEVLRDNKINHVQTAIRGHSSQTKIGLYTFDIATTEEGQPVQVTCAQGQVAVVEPSKGTERYIAHLDTGKCANCPFKDKCLASEWKSKPQRTLSFSAQDAEIARRRQRIAENQRHDRNLRVAVESTIASLKCPFNFGQLPVRGLFRVGVMMLGCAAMTNVRRIHRHIINESVNQKVNGSGRVRKGRAQTSFCSSLRSLTRSFHLFRVRRRQLHAFS